MLRKKPDDEAFLVPFKFPRRGRDQTLAYSKDFQI